MDKYKFLGVLCNRNISQRSLANVIGVNKDTLNSWTSGRSHIPEHRIEQICNVLQLDDPEEIVSIFLPGVSINH